MGCAFATPTVLEQRTYVRKARKLVVKIVSITGITKVLSRRASKDSLGRDVMSEQSQAHAAMVRQRRCSLLLSTSLFALRHSLGTAQVCDGGA